MRPEVNLRKALTVCATWLAQAVHAALPKGNKAVITGRPDYCDDVLALEEAMRETRLDKVVILVSSGKHPPTKPGFPALGAKTVVARRKSVRGMWHALTARYVFFTHTFIVPRFPASVVSVNLWHGMPVKRVGWMTESGKMLTEARYAPATSSFWAPVIQQSLRPKDGTLVTGLPRNDRLLLEAKGVVQKLGYSADSGARLIMLLPTHQLEGEGQTRVRHCLQPLKLGADALQEIDQLLGDQGAVMVVKPHPWAMGEQMPDCRHIRLVTDDWLREAGLTLHELLGESCALITDISSAYVDYLILDRPIIHHFPNIRRYGVDRGYSINPVDDYLAGPLTLDPEGFLRALSLVLAGEDTHADQRRRVRALFHTHTDGEAAARLLGELGVGSR